MNQEAISPEDIRDLMTGLVEGANEHVQEAVDNFGEEMFRNSLALVLTDETNQYGFVVRAKRFRLIEGEEIENLEATAIVKTTKDFFIEFLGSEDWVLKAIEGYNTYKVTIQANDGKNYVHYKNLMALLNWLYTLIGG